MHGNNPVSNINDVIIIGLTQSNYIEKVNTFVS